MNMSSSIDFSPRTYETLLKIYEQNVTLAQFNTEGYHPPADNMAEVLIEFVIHGLNAELSDPIGTEFGEHYERSLGGYFKTCTAEGYSRTEVKHIEAVLKIWKVINDSHLIFNRFDSAPVVLHTSGSDYNTSLLTLECEDCNTEMIEFVHVCSLCSCPEYLRDGKFN